MTSNLRTPRIVHPPGRGRWALRLFAAIGVLLAVAWLAYDRGQRSAGFAESTAGQTIAALRQQIRDMKRERRDLERRLAAAERAAQVDREAVGEMRKAIAQAEARRLESERRSEFLRQVIAKGAKGGVEIRDLKIVALPGTPRRFRVNLTLVQRIRSYPLTTGRLTLVVLGRRQGKEVRLPLKKVAVGKQGYVKAHFKHLQEITLDLNLPEDLEPTRLQLDFKPSGKQLLPLSETFDWQLEGGH